MITVDLTRIEQQTNFFNTSLEAAYADNDLRYLFYGGAIRGGKTFGCIAILIALCKLFPGSKWYVIRKSFTRIQETTLPTISKMLGNTRRVRWNRDKANYFVEFLSTGSRIFFAGEDLKTDPELDWMLGLECNGFFLEQVEELSEKCFDMCISRSGSWYIDPMPAPLILGSFNPTSTWVRKKVYDPWKKGELVTPYHFQEAFPDHNPWVTDEQRRAWKNMAADLYKKFIGGDWNFAKPPNVFAYAFDEDLHHLECAYDDDRSLFLSFDFNVEPITCLACQHSHEHINVLKEFRLINSDIDELCDHILTTYPNAHFIVTGDATGQNRTAMKKNWTYYTAIRHNLMVGRMQMKVPRGNPFVRNTRVLMNSMFSNHPTFKINKEACPHLVTDLNSVVVNDKGEIDDSGDKRKTHLLDCLRYYLWTWHRDFLDKSFYEYAGND